MTPADLPSQVSGKGQVLTPQRGWAGPQWSVVVRRYLWWSRRGQGPRGQGLLGGNDLRQTHEGSVNQQNNSL